MSRIQIREDAHGRSTGLYVLVGALAGMAVGFLVAERAGGLDGLRRRARGLLSRASAFAGEALGEDAWEDDADDAPTEDMDDGDDDPRDVLEARVLEAFVNDPVLSRRAVDISAVDDDGTVELTGMVRGAKEVPHAATIAGGVPGVRHVVNRLTVRRR